MVGEELLWIDVVDVRRVQTASSLTAAMAAAMTFLFQAALCSGESFGSVDRTQDIFPMRSSVRIEPPSWNSKALMLVLQGAIERVVARFSPLLALRRFCSIKATATPIVAYRL